MKLEEFLKPDEEGKSELNKNESITAEEDTDVSEIVQDDAMALHVQKAVVESLAAEKAEQDEHITSLRRENYAMRSEISALKEKIAEMKTALENVGDLLAKNSESPLSSSITLLERNPEVQDRFPGETRDHLLEVLREARNAAERDGRVRRAQILESVLVDNIPNGDLAKRRAALEKLFAANQNIVSGPVINELNKLNISYKHGENYLMPAEIIKRTY